MTRGDLWWIVLALAIFGRVTWLIARRTLALSDHWLLFLAPALVMVLFWSSRWGLAVLLLAGVAAIVLFRVIVVVFGIPSAPARAGSSRGPARSPRNRTRAQHVRGGPVRGRGGRTRSASRSAKELEGREAEQDQAVRRWLNALETGEEARRFEEAKRLAKMAGLHRANGRFEDASRLLGSWLAVAERSGDRLDHADVRKAFDMLAGLYRAGRRTDDIWALVDRWLTITEQGAPTASELTALLQHILALHKTSRDHTRREALLARWLGLAEAGPAHPGLAAALQARAEARQALGRHEEAEADYLRARLLREERLGAHHPEVLTTIERHAALLETTGRATEAETLRAEVRSIRGE